MALLYAASCFGLDETAMAALIAFGYTLLALNKTP